MHDAGEWKGKGSTSDSATQAKGVMYICRCAGFKPQTSLCILRELSCKAKGSAIVGMSWVNMGKGL